MNTSQGALYFGAGIDMNQWRRDITEMRRDILGLTNETKRETQRMDDAFKKLSLGIGAYFSVNALQGFTQQLIQVRGEFQKTEIAFATMLKSKEKAKELMGQMVDLAAKTPFGLQEVSDGAKRLLAFQIPANEVVETLRRMGDVAAGLGVPMGQLIHVYGQVKAQGKLMTNDLYQFMNAGIPILAELGKVLGKSEAEIKKMVGEGKIGFTEIQQVIQNMTNEGGLFFNMMEQQSASLSGKVSNLQDAFEQMLNKIGESQEGLLADGIDGVTYLVENYQEVVKILGILAASYGAIKTAVIAYSVVNSVSNKTLKDEIATLSISEKMKLGRAMVTQRQAEATLQEAKAEQVATSSKLAGLRAEVSTLAVKKQKLAAIALEKTQIVESLKYQATLAQLELRNATATGNASKIKIATKNAELAQNKLLAAQETAEIARKNAMSASTQFYTTKKQLENTATAVNIAQKRVENAQEALSVATKNANTIATTKLTIAQRVNVVATNLGAKAQALLNKTILANPYVVATALLGGLTYVIYKFTTAVEYSAQLQENLNSKLEEGANGVEKTKAEIETLVDAIKSENTTNEEKQGLLNKLNTLTENKIENLSIEKIKTGELDSQVKSYIETLYKQAEAMSHVSYLQDLYTKKREAEKNLKDYEEGDKEGLWNTTKQAAADFWTTIETGGRHTTEIGKLKGDLEAINKEIEKTKEKTNELSSYIPKEEGGNVVNATKEDKKGKKKELAEVYSKDSIKDLEERIKLWNEALARAGKDNQVKVRAKDKYGKEYETGKVVSKDFALQELEKLENLKKERQRELSNQSFDEELTELERQWRVRYLLAEKYGEEIAKKQFPDLKGESYFKEIEARFKVLEDRAKSQEGGLTEEEVSQWERLKNILDNLQGVKDPFTNFKEDLDDSLSVMDNFVDKVAYLEGKMSALTEEQKSSGYEAEVRGRLENVQREYQKFYDEFLKDQRTFEEKQKVISDEYKALRLKAKEDLDKGEISENRFVEISIKIDKQEAEKQTDLFLEELQKSDKWNDAFDNIERLTTERLRKLRELLVQQLDKAKSEAERRKIIVHIERVDKEFNPRKGFGEQFQDLKGKFKEYADTKKKVKTAQEEYNQAVEDFGKASAQAQEAEKRLNQYQQESFDKRQELANGIANFAQQTQKYTSEIQGIVGDIKGAFEDLGVSLDNSLGDALEKVEGVLGGMSQVADGAMKFAQGFASGNPIQMIGGAVKAIGGIIKTVGSLFNNDRKKERRIRKEAEAVNQLKSAYEDLARASQKAFGDKKYSSQTDLIKNLEQQKIHLNNMIREEDAKKKTDHGKIANWRNELKAIDRTIEDIKDNVIKDVLQTDVVDASAKMGDALVEAFGRGEDAAKSLEATANDLIKNLLKNQLNLAIQGKMKGILDRLFKETGLNEDGTGKFKGLSREQIERFKGEVKNAGLQMSSFLEGYKEIFNGLDVQGDSLKGAIRGMSEDTAGLLAGQFNAIRINTGEILKNQTFNLDLMKQSISTLIGIEQNTANLYQIKRDISELTSKVSGSIGSLKAKGII